MSFPGLSLGAVAWAVCLSGQAPASPGPEKVIPLPDITSVYAIKVADDRIYIVDWRQKEIFVFALDDLRMVRRFGRAGQGPGEFDSPPLPVLLPEGLAVKSFSKILFFSRDGELRREVKIVPTDLMFSGFPVFPVDGRFIGFPFVRDERGRMTSCVGRIYEEDWKPAGDFAWLFPSPTPSPPPPPGAKNTGPKEDYRLIRDYCAGTVEGGRIYVADSRKGLSITVFDARGTKIREIRPETAPVRIDRKFREELIASWREEMKNYLDHFNPVVPDVLPDFFAFRVDGAEIHAVTPRRRDGLYEIVTMNLEGAVLRRTFAFPLEPSWDYLPAVNNRFDIRDGILYATSYNEERERTELRIRPIK